MKRKFISVAVVVVMLGAAGFMWSNWSHAEGQKSIRLSGNIELTEVNVSFKTAGKLTELHAEEGSSVQRGMLLARIDRDQLEQQEQREQAGLVAAKSGLTQLGTDIQHAEETAQGEEALRQAELKAAQAHLQELLAGARPQEIRQAEAAVSDARTLHDQASSDWSRAQKLFANDDISASQRDQFLARYDSSAAALEQARERLALVREGTRTEQIDAARAQVERAQAALRLSGTNWTELKRKRQEVQTRQAEIQRASALVRTVQSQLADTVAESPIDGVVLSKSSDLGEVLSSGTTVMTVGDILHPWVRGYITEPDLGRVKVGASVRITTDSFPGKVYLGRVSFIASTAEFTPKHIQTPEERVKLVYRIKIEVDNSARELKLNMPVDAEILLD